MVRVAVASRSLPLPTKYIEHPPNDDLPLDLNVMRSPTPVYVALTCAVLVPAGSHPVPSHVNASTVMSTDESEALPRPFVSIENAPSASGAQPVS